MRTVALLQWVARYEIFVALNACVQCDFFHLLVICCSGTNKDAADVDLKTAEALSAWTSFLLNLYDVVNVPSKPITDGKTLVTYVGPNGNISLKLNMLSPLVVEIKEMARLIKIDNREETLAFVITSDGITDVHFVALAVQPQSIGSPVNQAASISANISSATTSPKSSQKGCSSKELAALLKSYPTEGATIWEHQECLLDDSVAAFFFHLKEYLNPRTTIFAMLANVAKYVILAIMHCIHYLIAIILTFITAAFQGEIPTGKVSIC